MHVLWVYSNVYYSNVCMYSGYTVMCTTAMYACTLGIQLKTLIWCINQFKITVYCTGFRVPVYSYNQLQMTRTVQACMVTFLKFLLRLACKNAKLYVHAFWVCDLCEHNRSIRNPKQHNNSATCVSQLASAHRPIPTQPQRHTTNMS